MNLDDIVYVLCLLVCIAVGKYVKKVRDESQRKLLSTTFGLVMIVVVSGLHGLHCVVSAVLGFAAVLYAHPRHCHLATFAVMFGYLTFIRVVHFVGIPAPPGHTNMIQMILTLKVAGVAFEKTAAWKKLQKREQQLREKREEMESADSSQPLVEISDYDVEVQDIGFAELFHYSFNYIGVLTGPYYRYRTYRDYFDTPFMEYADNIGVTMEKLKYAGLYCVLYLISNYIWPLSYALTDEFYAERSFLYRLWYIWPTFFIFRMRMYTGLTLSECVCTMAGFGAYPDEADVNNGEGPRKQYMQLKRDAAKRSYNFTAIVNTRVRGVETCWTFREGMKHWNVCVQYWLAINVYKLFPSKRYRTAATLLCSAYWHGFLPGHYFCIMGAPVYVPIEDMWNKLVRQDATGTRRQVIDGIFWVAKFFAYSYMGTAFLLVSFSNIWRFYSSVYHVGYIIWALLVVIGLFLTNQKKTIERQHRRLDEQKADGELAGAGKKLKSQ